MAIKKCDQIVSPFVLRLERKYLVRGVVTGKVVWEKPFHFVYGLVFGQMRGHF